MCWWWWGGCQTSRGLTVTDIQVEGAASSTLNSKQMWEAACSSWLMSSSTLLLRTSNRGLMHIISRHSPSGRQKKNLSEVTSWKQQSCLCGYHLWLSVVLCLPWPSEEREVRLFLYWLNGMSCGYSLHGNTFLSERSPEFLAHFTSIQGENQKTVSHWQEHYNNAFFCTLLADTEQPFTPHICVSGGLITNLIRPTICLGLPGYK